MTDALSKPLPYGFSEEERVILEKRWSEKVLGRDIASELDRPLHQIYEMSRKLNLPKRDMNWGGARDNYVHAIDRPENCSECGILLIHAAGCCRPECEHYDASIHQLHQDRTLAGVGDYDF